MGAVYVTYVADVDKEQWHVLTLVWSVKRKVQNNGADR